MAAAGWSLKLAGHELACDVPFRNQDVIHVEFEGSVTIKPGGWGMLVAPGGKTRIAVEIGLPKSPTLIECYLLGTLIPTPNLCLNCGRVLKEDEVVRRVPGMTKDPTWELCPPCWEIEAARQLRPSAPHLVWESAKSAVDDEVVEDENVLLDNQDFDFED